MILPFYHSGMGAVLPMKSMVPRVGHKVVVQVGRPLDLAHISCRCNQAGEDQEQVGGCRLEDCGLGHEVAATRAMCLHAATIQTCCRMCVACTSIACVACWCQCTALLGSAAAAGAASVPGCNRLWDQQLMRWMYIDVPAPDLVPTPPHPTPQGVEGPDGGHAQGCQGAGAEQCTQHGPAGGQAGGGERCSAGAIVAGRAAQRQLLPAAPAEPLPSKLPVQMTWYRRGMALHGPEAAACSCCQPLSRAMHSAMHTALVGPGVVGSWCATLWHTAACTSAMQLLAGGAAVGMRHNCMCGLQA